MSQTKLPSHFKLVFWAALILTVGAALAAILIEIVVSDSTGKQSLIDTFTTTFKMGFGAILGLLGGKYVT